MTTERKQTCWMSEHRCPKDGARLNTNGLVYWCSLVGCDYGVWTKVYACARCGAPLDNVAPGYSIVSGGKRVCTPCMGPGEEIARARGLA